MKAKVQVTLVRYITDQLNWCTERSLNWYQRPVAFDDFDFLPSLSRLRDAHSVVSVACRSRDGSPLATQFCKAITTKLSGPITLYLPALDQQNMACVHHLLMAVPATFDFNFTVNEEEMNRLMKDGFFNQARIFDSTAIQLGLRVYWPNGATANIPLLYKAEASGQDLAGSLQSRIRGSGEEGWLFTVFVAASRLDNPHGLYHRCVNDTTWDDRCLNDDLYKKTSYLDTVFFVRRYRDSESNAARQKDAQAWYDAAHIHDEVDKHRDDWTLALITEAVNKRNGDPLEGKWGVEIYVRATVEKPCPPWGTDKPSMRTGISAEGLGTSEDWSYWYSGNLVQNAQEIEAYWFL